MNRALRVGDRIKHYKITAMSVNSILAFSVSKCEVNPFVVWYLDYDRTGVHSGEYFSSHEEACKIFADRVILETAFKSH